MVPPVKKLTAELALTRAKVVKTAKQKAATQAAKPKKALGELLAELANPAPDNFDPETDGADGFGNNNDSDSDGPDNDNSHSINTAHYLAVGEGNIRRQLGRNLDTDNPKYQGKPVSRRDLNRNRRIDDDNDDEEESDDNDGDDDGNGDENDNDSHGSDNEDGSDNDEELEQESEETDTAQIAENLKRMAEKEKELLKNLVTNKSSDVEKGLNVRNQMSIWESLLDLRIQIQPSLIAANILPLEPSLSAFISTSVLPTETIAKTATALATAAQSTVDLINTLLDTRAELSSHNETVTLTPPDFCSKRKRQPDRKNDEINLEEIWDRISSFDAAFDAGFRDTTIEKWSNKVTAVASAASSAAAGKKFTAINLGALAQIRNVLADSDRLLKRTRLVRGGDTRRLGTIAGNTLSGSNKDVNGSAKNAMAAGQNDGDGSGGKTEREEIEEREEQLQLKRRAGKGLDAHLSNFDDEIFDDGDFYQQLLKELIEGRLLETGVTKKNGTKQNN
ncbi:hypothetical protein HK100_011644 [Physocladia obscura]|uniref:AATF leucine zipper-containing domain-containing protein n=1 Tax=Physocladia obscura TaxID=109957 RepID=A0AAD5T2M0_9FUNG|nr:hypothetical protein HK100_011644 [Physocladia obscura]